jgi:hypothetical protein
MKGILIGCKSAWQMPDRRKRVLGTLMADVARHRVMGKSPQCDAVLLLGTLQAARIERYGYFLILPCPNSYQHMVQKLRLFCQWALEHDWWDYVMTIDDDTRLDLDRLLGYDPHHADYIGAEWKPGVGYASGNGYLLSRRAAAVIAERMTEWEGCYDALVGHHLSAAGIPLTVENDRFRILAEPGEAPGPDNDWIYANDNQMHFKDG